MKTWEMIKELIENPGKEFISDNLQADGERMAYIDSCGCISFKDKYGNNYIYKIQIERRWEEVKEPVTFMEAAGSGKRMRVEHELITDGENDLEEFQGIGDLLVRLVGTYYDTDVRTILSEGEFYIED